MERWNTLSDALVSTERLVSTSTDATPAREPADGRTTRPSVSRAGTWSVRAVRDLGPDDDVDPADHPIVDVEHRHRALRVGQLDRPGQPPPLRLPLKAPERMSVSDPSASAIDGRPPLSGSTLRLHRARPAS